MMKKYVVIAIALACACSVGAFAGNGGSGAADGCGMGGAGAIGVERSLLVEAPVEEVWDKSLDVNSWPEWIPFIKSASFKGEDLEIGSKFKLVLLGWGMPLPFTLTVCEREQYKRIAWSTGHPKAVRVARALIYEEKDGKTLVTSREQFTGPMAKYALRMVGEDALGEIHLEWLEAIKLRVEGHEE